MKNDYFSNNETKLWKAFKHGSEIAFADIYQKYFYMLFNYGMQIAKDEDLVKDCIQNLFVDIWDTKETLGDTNSIKYYLFKCLKRRIVAEILANRKYKKIEELTESYDFEIVRSHEFIMIADQASKEQNDDLLQALNKLSKRQKEAIYLLYYNNFSYREVALLMSIKVPAVYNLMYNALINLKKIMTQASVFLFLMLF